MLDQAWKFKRSLTDKISTSEIDNIYDKAIRAGALGGKLLGAGGGGFMLLFVPPENQLKIRQELKDLLEVGFNFENQGSQIIYYNSDNI